MKLSAPIYRLKRKAKLLAREATIPLHEALDRVAAHEGFSSWSLLASKLAAASPASKLYSLLAPGDLVLLSARAGHGKTLLSLELAVEAMNSGRKAVFFTLEYTDIEVAALFRSIGHELAGFESSFVLDTSETISAASIAAKICSMAAGTFVVVDYLQLLDQRRENPPLTEQVRALKVLARECGATIVFISQIARTYDPAKKVCPDLSDVRLPNPLDLRLFDKACFLHDGNLRFQTVT